LSVRQIEIQVMMDKNISHDFQEETIEAKAR
ncbi:MAG: hypothetical protein QG641_728, partial [Candidatus Poribacteria bacterium]|nr:hypothetical protein [Candidatus Poribacteria bacterium]